MIGTGKWFLEHPKYVQWRQNQGQCFLFLTAGPGYGKSVLMHSVVDNDIAPTETRITCYFFFRDVSEQQRSITEALSAILHQLFRQRPKLLHLAEDTFANFGSKMSERFTPLWDLLIKCAKACNEPIYCIIDAIDECDNENRKDLIRVFKDYYGKENHISKSQGMLRFLVSGRAYLDHSSPQKISLTTCQMKHIYQLRICLSYKRK